MIDKVGKLITKIFGSKSDKDIKGIQPLVDQIKSFGPAMEKLSDDELKAKTEGFKNQIQEATKEARERIAEIKKELDNIEDLSPAEHRELADELEEQEKEELKIIDGVLDDILPEAYAVLKGKQHF